ncbi:c-type cytochrome [Hyphomonas sp.]|uniref:c-type cytochrome n=1 Tax=Hyphomonas sp. TaxID=87 RepID=UPI00391DB880
MRRGLALSALFAALTLLACNRTSEPPVAEAPPVAKPVITEQDEMIGRGEAIAETACASCHAIGAETESPHPYAPPFSLLDQVVDIGTLKQTFTEGINTDHPDMPNWQFEEIDLDGLVAYLESVQAGASE